MAARGRADDVDDWDREARAVCRRYAVALGVLDTRVVVRDDVAGQSSAGVCDVVWVGLEYDLGRLAIAASSSQQTMQESAYQGQGWFIRLLRDVLLNSNREVTDAEVWI